MAAFRRAQKRRHTNFCQARNCYLCERVGSTGRSTGQGRLCFLRCGASILTRHILYELKKCLWVSEPQHEARLPFPYVCLPPGALSCLMFPCFSTFTCQPAPINPHSSPPPHSGVHSSMAGGWKSRGHKKQKMASAGTAPKKLLQIIPRLHLSRRIWLAAAGKEF